MAINPDTVQVGDVLYGTHREKAGNTTMSRTVVTRYVVKSIREAKNSRYFTVDRNHGWRGSEMWHAEIKNLSRSPPEWVPRLFEGPTCYLCSAKKHEGHRATCTHPRAIKARKQATKEAP